MEATSRLNIDVLATVCEFITEVSDLLSVSLVCSSANVFAVKWLLLTRPVHIKSGSSIPCFHSFLFANLPARAPHVRVVHIDLRWRQSETDDCSLLLNILASCKRIESLTLAFEQASLNVVSDPRFRQAIVAIPNLRSLFVRSYSVDVLAHLPHFIRPPLRMICVYYANSSVNSRFPGIIEQVLPRGVMQTLEKLELDKFAIDPHDIQHQINLPMASIPTTSVFNMARYPAVRSLSVGSFEGKPLLDHLQHLFPALDGTLHFGWFDMRYREDSYAGIRDINQRSQESDRDGSDSPLRGWKKLDRIICSASTLYVLGLRCPIRLAMINCEGVEKYRYAADALRENPVPRLKLTLYHEPGMFDGLFSPELAETLTHLTLCLLYSNNYPLDADAAPRLQWDTLLAMLVPAIQPLKGLTHLRVVVGASVFVHKEASWPFAPWEEYAHSLRGSRFDYQGTAAALACALPSLHYVLLTTGGFLSNWDEEGGRWKPYERWYISRAWRVATPGNGGVPDGERKLVQLHDDVAETIIRKEELVLSRSDEASLHLNYGWGSTPPPLSVP